MAQTAPQPLFNRAQLRRNRMRFAHRFEAHGVLFDETAAGLLERLPFIKREFHNVLEIGARNTRIAKALAAPGRSITRMGLNAAKGIDVIGEEEFLPFGARSAFLPQ